MNSFTRIIAKDTQEIKLPKRRICLLLPDTAKLLEEVEGVRAGHLVYQIRQRIDDVDNAPICVGKAVGSLVHDHSGLTVLKAQSLLGQKVRLLFQICASTP